MNKGTMFGPTATLLMIILSISISECLGQSCLKTLFDDPKQYHLYFAAVLFYSIVCYLLVLSYTYKGMGLVNVLWSGLSILIILSTGALFFNETISRLDIIGVFFVILGMICILWEGAH
jgi:multidrug transporter EmrE-like cation transporter